MKRLATIAVCAAPLLLVLTGAVAATPAAAATTIHVPGSYSTIQEGIDAANPGDTVEVAAGIYYENIVLKSGVTVQGAGADVTTIDGGGGAADVVTAIDLDPDFVATLDGFTITGGNYGVYNRGASPTISNNRITGYDAIGIYNLYSSPTIAKNTIVGDGAIYDTGIRNNFSSSPTIINNIITGNWYGIYSYYESSPTITNNTITDNHKIGIANQSWVSANVANNIITNNARTGIWNGSSSSLMLEHNNVWGNEDVSGTERNYENDYGLPFPPGPNDISQDPLFVDAAAGDYHLQPGSPCIDAGWNDAESLPSTDFEGDPRILDGDGDSVAVADIGADELSNNAAPVADAGQDQAVRVGDSALLDGNGSFDDNTSTPALEFLWTITGLPLGSEAVLEDASSATPSFVVDSLGTYAIQLVVTDGAGLSSLADEMLVSSENLAPTAEAGDDQLVVTGSVVTLDGSASSDPENDPLSFVWSLSSPDGSAAVLWDSDLPNASLIPDVEGHYVVHLLVSDWIGPSLLDEVVVTATEAHSFAEIQIVAAGATIAALPAGAVTTAGNQKALTNFLSQATQAIQKGKLDQARGKLAGALTRSDGCILRGSPDGNGPDRDWILDCDVQTEVYSSLTAALSAIEL